MPLSDNHHDLFHQSSAADKISMFESLLGSHDLNQDEALALLKSIHAELEQPEGHDRSVYEDYAQMMEELHHEMPDVHQYVVTNWKSPRHVEAEEEFVEEDADEEESGEGESE